MSLWVSERGVFLSISFMEDLKVYTRTAKHHLGGCIDWRRRRGEEKIACEPFKFLNITICQFFAYHSQFWCLNDMWLNSWPPTIILRKKRRMQRALRSAPEDTGLKKIDGLPAFSPFLKTLSLLYPDIFLLSYCKRKYEGNASLQLKNNIRMYAEVAYS